MGLQAEYLYNLPKNIFVSGGILGAIDTQNYNNTQTGITASIGIAYKIAGSRIITIEPTYSYFFNKTTDMRQILQIQPYTIGLKAALRLKK